MSEPVIRMENIVKTYYLGKPNELEILHGINLTVNKGEFVSIVGESGSGKSTLMNIIGADHRPNELSGGQKQRVAIARAMINDPAIILADEPTGALDSKTGHMVMDLFHKLHEEQGKTIVLITHSQELAQETERIVTLLDGQIVADNGGEH